MNWYRRLALRLAFGRRVTEKGIVARTLERTLRTEGCSRLMARRLASTATQALVDAGLFEETMTCPTEHTQNRNQGT